MNAGQMFMSMVQGVTQPVTPDLPLTAQPLSGEQSRISAVFADLLSEIRTQSNAKAVSADGFCGAIVQPTGSELQEEFSVSGNSTEVLELSGAETVRSQESSGIQDESGKPESAELNVPRENVFPGVTPENLEMYAAGTQVILAAYAQPGRTPAVDSPPGHEVDSVQNVSTVDDPLIQPAEQTGHNATVFLENRLPHPDVSASTARETKDLTAKTAASELVAAPAMEIADGPEAFQQMGNIKPVNQAQLEPYEQNLTVSRQQSGRMPAVSSPSSHEVDRSQNVTMDAKQGKQLFAAESPVTVRFAEQAYRSLKSESEHRLALLNTPASHKVDNAQNVTIASEPEQQFFASDTPVKVSLAEQPQHYQPQTAVKQNAGSVTPDRKSNPVETSPISTPEKQVLQSADNSHHFTSAEQDWQLPPQTNVFSSTEQISAKTATVKFEQTQTAAAPVMEVAVKPEANQKTEHIPSIKPFHSEAPVQKPAMPQQQPDRMPVVNSPSSHKVDSTQNTAATTVAAELPHVVSAAQVAAQPLSGQTESIVPANQQSGLAEAVPVITTDKPILKPAEQTYRIATAEPEQRLPQQPDASSSATATAQTTEVTQATTHLSAKTAAPEFVQTQSAAAPVKEVAAEPETNQRAEQTPSVKPFHSEAPVQKPAVPQQQPDRMPVVNSPSSHKVDSTQNTAATTVAAELPHIVSAAQVTAQPLSGQTVSIVPANQQSSLMETTAANEIAGLPPQTGTDTESLSATLPTLQLPRTPATVSSESEAEISFSMHRPIVVSKARSTESSRMQQTSAILRPQIISLDIDQPQNNATEFGTVSAVTSETSSVADAQRHENGRTPEAIFTPNPDIGLTQKVRTEALTTNTEKSVKPSEEANPIKATKDINSAPMQQAIRGVTIQVSPNANNEISKPDSSQTVAKENTVFQQIAVPALEAQNTSDDSMGNSGDQTWSGQKSENQMVTSQIHAQSKTEPHTAVTVPNVRNNAEQVRQDIPEQIAQQVRERLTRHEVKPGNQQISLTLSPENMGELKMNLNLQGQQLSVEIVTESRAVRDAIMQHSDSLKESLARQNISVESFDVTSNGRGSGNPGHNNQDAWKELARQKQQQLWTSSGGYRLPQMDATPNTLAHQAKNEHGMLDIHY